MELAAVSEEPPWEMQTCVREIVGNATRDVVWEPVLFSASLLQAN